MSQDANDFLSSGAPAVKFENVGDYVKGVVRATAVTQQMDYDTQDPAFYKDGNPMMQLVVTLANAEGPAAVKVDDEGCARLFVKGAMRAAVGTAVRASGAKLDIGGTLVVKHSGTKPNENPRLNDIKLYEAKYVPGAVNAADDLLNSSSDTPSETPAQSAGPSIDDIA